LSAPASAAVAGFFAARQQRDAADHHGGLRRGRDAQVALAARVSTPNDQTFWLVVEV
jgi:hypothetical protein